MKLIWRALLKMRRAIPQLQNAQRIGRELDHPFAILALAIGILGAALNVRYRDVGTLAPILLQVWMFVSPLVYSSSIVPEKSRFLYSLNPLVGLIDGFRASLFNLPLPWTSMIISAVVTWPLLIFAIHVFRKMEVSFADDV